MFGRVKQAVRKEAGHYQARANPNLPKPHLTKYIPKGKHLFEKGKPRVPRQGVSPMAQRQIVPPAFRLDFTPRVLTIEPVDVGLFNNPNLHGISLYRKKG